MRIDRPHPPAEETRQDRQPDVAEALRNLRTFTREQVAWLMQTAMRWGYELRDEEDRGYWAGYQARVNEENTGWPEPTVFCAGDVINGINQRAYRHQCDQAAGLPRPGDHRGGPVPVWGNGDDRTVAA